MRLPLRRLSFSIFREPFNLPPPPSGGSHVFRYPYTPYPDNFARLFDPPPGTPPTGNPQKD